MVSNTLLIGPPKCGTSSLYDWLAVHPDVAASQPKETFFLMDRDSPLRRSAAWDVDGDEGYARFFPEGVERPVRLDATTHHIFQDTARSFARQHAGTRVVCVLREPAARLRSSFEFTKHNLSVVSDGVGFSQYVSAVQRAEKLYPQLCRRRESAFVLERDIGYGEYVRYLRAWRDAVGAEQMFICTFDDLVVNPREVMRRLCGFLGIDAGIYENFDFPRKNETVAVRSHGLHRLARKFGSAIRDSRVKRIVKRAYLRLQTGKRRRLPSDADSAVMQSLREHYRQYNRDLASEFNLDLRSWGY